MRFGRIRRWVVGAVGAVALASCGGGSDDASSTTEALETTVPATSPTTTAAPSTSPATTPPVTSAPATTEASSTAPATSNPSTTGAPSTEAELAASALFTLNDFGEGWTEEPYEPSEDPDNDALLEQIAECSGLDVNLIAADPLLGDTKVKSSRFESPDESASVEQTLGFAPDEATALAAMAEIGDERLAPCYEVAIAEVFSDPANIPEGMEVGEVSMNRVDLTGVAEPDEAVWYEVFVPITFQDQNIDQHLELLFLRTGRVMTQLELVGTGAAFPNDQLDPVIELAISRAESIA